MRKHSFIIWLASLLICLAVSCAPPPQAPTAAAQPVVSPVVQPQLAQTTTATGVTPATTPAPAATPMPTLQPSLAIQSPSPAPAQTGGTAPLPDRQWIGPIWSTGAKMGIGTAFTYNFTGPPEQNPSRVWFTLANGMLSEVMYPTIDIANMSGLQLYVGDSSGSGQNLSNVALDAIHVVTRTSLLALDYTVVSTDKQQRYRITQEWVANPARNSVLTRTRFEALQGKLTDYRVYAVWYPQPNNTAADTLLHKVAAGNSQAAVATNRSGPVAIALLTGSPPVRSSFWLRSPDEAAPNLARLAAEYERAEGVVAATYEFLPAINDTWLSAIGFGTQESKAVQDASDTLAAGWQKVAGDYSAGWLTYASTLDTMRGVLDPFGYLSVMTIKAHEDKTYKGAIIASLAQPWGNWARDKQDDRGYRYVWTRDLYHAAQGLRAAGDIQTAREVLAYLARVQRPDGSWPQNMLPDGSPHWTGIQMDEIGFPIILANQLDAQELYGSMVKKAADFIVRSGPKTQQERWEEAGGYSPSTLAVEIAGLICAASMAEKAGDATGAGLYRQKADEWMQKIDDWTLVRQGPYSPLPYYMRVNPDGTANGTGTLRLANGGATVEARSVVDPSFLELVRLGIKPANGPAIQNTVQVIDAQLRVETPRGPAWYRYNGDKYGEEKPGSYAPGQGHLWPLLAGERGMYELMAKHDAKPYLEALRKFAGAGSLLPEQVFADSGAPTGSAMPLVWAEAEYLVLLRSINDGEPFDRPVAPFARYAGQIEGGP